MSDLKVIAAEQIKILQSLDLDLIESLAMAIAKTSESGAFIWIVGNGGSATTAAHLATDLSKGVNTFGSYNLRAICLNEFLGINSAWSNDFGYEVAISNQVKYFCKPDDIIVFITGSGNSKNLIEAAKMAKSNDLQVYSLTGMNGGEIAQYSDLEIRVPSQNMQLIENTHLFIVHALFARLKDNLDDEG